MPNDWTPGPKASLIATGVALVMLLILAAVSIVTIGGSS